MVDHAGSATFALQNILEADDLDQEAVIVTIMSTNIDDGATMDFDCFV